MSDVGKLDRGSAQDVEDPAVAEADVPASALEQAAASRQRAGGELAYRASGGRGGVAPMQRLMDERRAVGGQLAGRIQRKADGGGDASGVEVPEGGGTALPKEMQQKFEGKLGADLSDVRVHTGGASAQAASGLGARAFTVGRDVHFNAGEFAPGSKEGDKLLAHELTHVVQGKKSGVQRKADEGAEAKGEGQGGAEVSHPDEPAEKEADAVADQVAGDMHGDKNDKKKDGKGGGKQAREHGGGGGDQGAAHGDHGASQEAGEHAHGEGEAKEKPAPISAKFVGVGRQIMRAKKKGGGGPAPSDSAASDPSKGSAKPSLKIEAKTDSVAEPPAPQAATRDPGAWGAYEANWSGQFVPTLKQNGIDDKVIAGLAGKKSSWFEDAYTAVESGKNHQAVVDRIFAEIPKEPAGQDKHFWSGGSPAQGMADKAIKGKGAGAGGAPKAMRLETSHVGCLFNGVFNQPPSKLDWAKQAIKFWERASTNYAKATTGTVTAHLNVDFKYATNQKVNRGAIFGKFELPEIVTNMKTRSPDGKTVVSALVLDMSIHGATKDAKGKDKNVDKKASFTIAANPGVNEQQILDAIDAQIQAAVNA